MINYSFIQKLGLNSVFRPIQFKNSTLLTRFYENTNAAVTTYIHVPEMETK